MADGAVLIAGGQGGTGGGQPLDSVEVFDPAANAVLGLPTPLPAPRAAHGAAATAAGQVLLAGGEDAQGFLSALDLFVPAQGAATRLSLTLPVPRAHHSLTTLSDGRLLLIGGLNGANLPLPSALLMDAKLQTITPAHATLGTGRAHHSAVLLPDGRVAVIAGVGPGGTPLTSIEIYDPATDTVVPSPVALAVPRADAASVLLPDGRIWVLGGQGRADTEIVDLARGTVTAGPALSGPRSGHSATLLPDGRTLLAGGTDGARALASLEVLAPLVPDQTPPRVVHVSPADGAIDVPLDAMIALRFSEALRVTTVTSANLVLTGPGGRVEGSVAIAESGLLAFFTPASPLTPDASYTLALAGLTDTAGNPLAAFSARFTTGKAAGEPPTVKGFTPTAGAAGDAVTITGTNFGNVSAVRFGGIAAAAFTPLSATQVRAIVPAGALTGPVSVTTPAGTGQSQGYFVVLAKPDFQLAAAPDRGETVQGDSTVLAIRVLASGGFTGLVRPIVTGLPFQLRATFDKPLLGPAGFAYLTVRADPALRPADYRFTITGTAPINGQDVQRSLEVTVRVLAASGTSLSGHVRRLDGVPIANAIFRVGTNSTRTDVAGNFLLRNVPAQTQVVFVLDARPASTPSLEYPVFEMVMTGVVPNRPNKVNPGPIWLPTMDPRNALPVSTGQDSVLKPPQFPGMEVALKAGTTLTDVDGRPVTRVNAALIPLDRGPFPMPPHVRVAFLYTLQPSGTLATQPLTVTLPNPAHLAPNTRITLWAHDPRKGGWYSPGQATVSEDGTQIKPDAGVQVTRFSCLGGAPGEDTLRVCPEGGCAVAGMGVDVTSGVYTHRFPLFRQAGVPPLDLGIVYRSASTTAGWFGTGTKPDVDILLGTAGGGSTHTIVLPTGYHIYLTQGTPYTADAVFYGAVLTTAAGGPGGWKFTHKDGTVWWFHDPSGYLVALDDRNGNRLTLTRDPNNGGLKTLGLPDGRTLYVDSTTGPGIQVISAALDQTYRFTIVATPDGKYELRTITDPLGQQTTFTYDSNHNLLTWTNPRGITVLTNQYDASQRVTRQTLADGAVWQYAYTVAGGLVTQTVVTDPRGNPTTYAISPAGYITSVTNALGQTTTFTRGTANAITQVVDPLNRTTLLGYGGNLNVTSVIRYLDPPANTQPVTWAFTYGVNSQLSSVTDPLGHTTTYGLDSKGNVTTITDPLTHTTSITRNTLGLPTTITDPLSNTTTIAYNSFNLPASTTDSMGNVTGQAYDLLGRQITQTDPRGFTSRSSYDVLNRLTSTADPLGAGVRLEYDPNGNTTKVTDAANNAITYTYNNMDRVSVRTDQLGQQESFSYDLAGNLTGRTDRKGQTTTFAYDAMNRRNVTTYQGGATVTATYDAGGRMTSLADSVAGTITWIYDAVDRVTTETTPQGTVSYAYDNANRRTTMTVAGQTPVSYSYDNANRVLTISKDALVASYAYDNANRRTSLTLPNGVTTDYSYDIASRLTGLTYRNGGTTLGTLTYIYDPGSNRVLTGGSWARTLLPDPVSSATYDAANRQLTLGGKSMTYDFSGNLGALTEGGNTTTYTWDARDRLTSMAGPGLSASFTYDALARRQSKTITGFTTNIQYDGLDIAREVAGGSGVNYLRGRGIDEPLARIEDGGNTTCYVPDALGSTLALTDSVGGVSTEYTYEPFGRTVSNGATSPNVFQFTSRENDGTGTYYYRARYYHPFLGRFLQEDPIGLAPSDANLYGYVRNNPLRFADPLGLVPKQVEDCALVQIDAWKACMATFEGLYDICEQQCRDSFVFRWFLQWCIDVYCKLERATGQRNCTILLIEGMEDCARKGGPTPALVVRGRLNQPSPIKLPRALQGAQCDLGRRG